jgi:hypothetical protein
VVVFELGFTIFTMLKRKSQFFIAQIHYHIAGQLFKSVSTNSVDVLLLMIVEIKVVKLLKIRSVVYKSVALFIAS